MADREDHRNETGWEAESPSPQNPRFMDAANDDFRIHSQSAAKNNGMIVSGRNSDFYGNRIVRRPDIGAVEYQE